MWSNHRLDHVVQILGGRVRERGLTYDSVKKERRVKSIIDQDNFLKIRLSQRIWWDTLTKLWLRKLLCSSVWTPVGWMTSYYLTELVKIQHSTLTIKHIKRLRYGWQIRKIVVNRESSCRCLYFCIRYNIFLSIFINVLKMVNSLPMRFLKNMTKGALQTAEVSNTVGTKT